LKVPKSNFRFIVTTQETGVKFPDDLMPKIIEVGAFSVEEALHFI